MNYPIRINAARYPLLSGIETPADLRKLDVSELRAVADELRTYLIECVGHSGGHFGAGLGVIALTTALHYLYDTPAAPTVRDLRPQPNPPQHPTGPRPAHPPIRST